MRHATDVMNAIKSDYFIEQPPIQMSDWIARTLQQNMMKLPFASFFQPKTILVPVPKSSLMQPDTLWVPSRIATALVRRGIGKEVVQYLVRVKPLRKAASSDPWDRPTPTEQFDTMRVQGRISEPPPNDIVLVDDIVTRGHTLCGAANRIAEAIPKVRINAFAAMRTISNPSDFVAMYDPCSGTIEYRDWADDTLRRP